MSFNLISFSQSLEKHRWKDRILLVISADKNSKEFKNQLEILKKEKTGLLDRKLMTYAVYRKEFHFNFTKKETQSSKLFDKFNKEEVAFKIVLIGLDGGIKLAQDTILSTEKLFAIIDGMPIRKRELRKNEQ